MAPGFLESSGNQDNGALKQAEVRPASDHGIHIFYSRAISSIAQPGFG